MLAILKEMAFFGNSGVTFPHLDDLTSDAGKLSLGGASSLFGILAEIEGEREGTHPDFALDRIHDSINRLNEAAKLYRTVSSEVDGSYVPPLSPVELELAAIDQPPYFDPRMRGPFPRYKFPYGPFYDEEGSMRWLYEELVRRLQLLASRLALIDPRRQKEEIAPLVFQIMRDWDELAKLGRVIAVVNRRAWAMEGKG